MRVSGRDSTALCADSTGKSIGQNAIAESSFSGLSKYVCKGMGIKRCMRYRNAIRRGTIYADLCGIRN
jgi:hypothetical protein